MGTGSAKPVQGIEGYRREMDPGEILVLTGPPAVGKTTVAELVVGQWDLSVHLQADYFWDEFIRSGFLRPWMPESHDQNTIVINAITAAAVEYAKGGYSVLVDGIVGPWFVELVAETLVEHKVRWHYEFVDIADLTACLEVLERLPDRQARHLSTPVVPSVSAERTDPRGF